MVVLTDYESIYKIIHYNILNIISIDWTNRCLINASAYLFVYQLDMYYMPGCLNFVLNAFLYFRVLKDNVVCENNTEPVLNAL